MLKCITVLLHAMGRSERIITSVTEEQKRAVRLAAARQDMTMSEYLRIAVLEKVAQEDEEGNGKSTLTNADKSLLAQQKD